MYSVPKRVLTIRSLFRLQPPIFTYLLACTRLVVLLKTELLDMASGLKIGQHIQGKFDTYSISGRLHKDVWTAL